MEFAAFTINTNPSIAIGAISISKLFPASSSSTSGVGSPAMIISLNPSAKFLYACVVLVNIMSAMFSRASPSRTDAAACASGAVAGEPSIRGKFSCVNANDSSSIGLSSCICESPFSSG
jgi:hypothetical protein